jgi:N-methylhydantoinase A
MAWFVGVDVGGTFTDFHAYDDVTGAEVVHKTASTPANPSRAIVDGLQALCRANGIALDAVGRLAHGTTVATNALIQRRGGRVALVTTEGFRDLLEIGRQTRPHMYNLQVDHPQPLVPRQWRFEIAERLTATGAVHRAIDEAELSRLVDVVAGLDIDSIAVCFLFSFVNPAHEIRVAEALKARLPNLLISRSSEVQPEFREYERFSTTVLNAYLQPVMARYLGDLGSEVKALAPNIHIGINQSSGGLMSIERSHRFPIRTALSGPAAGAIGAIHVAHMGRRPNVITLDMGGTSADVALIRDGRAGTGFDRTVGGFPVRLPMIDIHTIGAGGGSIAWFDRDGLLKVGPVSAGASPGPACYGAGGRQATVTDANLVLGRLSPKGLLGGRMALDAAAAARSLAPIAERLGFGIERTAHGILGIVVANMVRAIRAVSVERGHDPRKFSLMPFGGAGPLHATDVARNLGIFEIVVPPAPGILCAQGLVVSDLKEDFVRTSRMIVSDESRGDIAAVLGELSTDARRWLAGERIAPATAIATYSLDMRYVGQNFELAVELGVASASAPPPLPTFGDLKTLFFSAHERNYGYFNPDDPLEVVNFRLTAEVRRPKANPPAPVAPQGPPPVSVEMRPVHFVWETAVATPVYRRADLTPGRSIEGPAVIDQLDATTIVFPGDRLTVDAAHNLIVEVRS